MPWTKFSAGQVGCALIATLLSVGALGCGTGGKGTVTGEITLDGQPLKAGNISFLAAKGGGARAVIQDGKYTATDVPTGEAGVVVETASIKKELDEARKASPGGQPPGMPPGMKKTSLPPQAQKFFEEKKKAADERATFLEELRVNFRPVPDKYGDYSTSGLSLKVKSGENKFPINLTSR